MARRITKKVLPFRRSYQVKPNPEMAFKYLDDLKTSGAVNMWAAAATVAEHFGCTMADAREVIDAWRKERMAVPA